MNLVEYQIPLQDNITMEYTTFLKIITALIFDVVLTTMAHNAINSVLKKLEFAPLVAWETKPASMYPLVVTQAMIDWCIPQQYQQQHQQHRQ